MKLTFRRGMAGIATAALTLGAATIAAPAMAANGNSDEFVMYITDWGPTDTVKRLHESGAANYITTINYAFGDVRPANLTRAEAYADDFDWTKYNEADHGPIVCAPAEQEFDFFTTWSAEDSITGKEEPGGMIEQVRLLKQAHPQIKVVPSIGGWSLSKWFSVGILTEESRQTLVDSCIDLWIDGNYVDDEFGAAENFAGVFDGIDIDYEYPMAYPSWAPNDPEPRGEWYNSYHPEDGVNYTQLARQFREALGDDALLTAATPASDNAGSGYDFTGMAQYLDWFAIMGYDLHGGWEDEVGNGAGILDKEWGVADSVKYYTDKGIDPSQIVLGVPFYGPAWTDVQVNDDGSFYTDGEKWGAPARIGVPGTPVKPVNTFTWRQIQSILADNPDLEIQWDPEFRVSYLFDSETSTYYSFDSPRALQDKVNELYKDLNLRGIMAWEFDGDTDDAELSLTIARAMGLPFVETVPFPADPAPEVPEAPELPDGGAQPVVKQPAFTG